jgi:hypothetical protein
VNLSVSEDLSKAPPILGDEEVDPELLGLPDPPKKERTMTLVLLAVTALAALAMVFALRRDAAYAFVSPRAVQLGSLQSAATDTFSDNLFVNGSGMLGAAGAIRYERPFEGDSYRLSPVAGRQDLWVEVRVPAGQENARYVPPTRFDGRLVRLDRAGPRHRGLAKAAFDATGQEVPTNAWLLVDGESPSNARWAVALVALFLAFAMWNLAVIARLVRRVA